MQHSASTTAFYAVADANHFLGLVGMVNSLRLVGHEEPIYVTDCGLTGDQRETLAPHVTLAAADGGHSPHLVKTVAPLGHPADVMILVDADIIVTRRLDDLTDSAGSGKVVAFTDRVAHRFDERWSAILALGPLRRQPYVNSGLVAMGREIGIPVLERLADGCRRVDADLSYTANGSSDYPFFFLDQDVLNAVLATRAPEELDFLDHALAPVPPFPGLRVLDETTLRCSYADGREPFALHHVLAKPWLTATRWNEYSRLLGRLLLARDVAVRLEPESVPRRFRPGATAWLERRRNDAIATLGGARGKLGVRRLIDRHLMRSDRRAGSAVPPAENRADGTPRVEPSSLDPGP
jgi:hypothetical protein